MRSDFIGKIVGEVSERPPLLVYYRLKNEFCHMVIKKCFVLHAHWRPVVTLDLSQIIMQEEIRHVD